MAAKKPIDWTSLVIMGIWMLVFGVMPFVLTVTNTSLGMWLERMF